MNIWQLWSSDSDAPHFSLKFKVSASGLVNPTALMQVVVSRNARSLRNSIEINDNGHPASPNKRHTTSSLAEKRGVHGGAGGLPLRCHKYPVSTGKQGSTQLSSPFNHHQPFDCKKFDNMGSTETSKGDLLIATDVIVIGAGFSGLYALHKVRQLGLSVKVIDAGSDFGGTWHWNRYPGARVDTEAPLYALSIPELWKNWTWSERFPAHDELRRYFQFAGATLDTYKDTHFKTIVDGAVYRNNQWNLKIRGGGAATCTYLILSTGSSYKTHFPQFMDLDKYQGQLIHSALYPEAGIDVKGKRVAVIGSGASGIQVVQELAKQDCDLTQYVRTPNIALPMANRQFSAGEQETGKNFYEMLYRNVRNHQSGFPYNAPKGSFGELTKDERNAQLEYLWDRSGFVFLTGNHRDYLLDRETNKFFYDFWLEKTRARIRDDEKREILAPVEQVRSDRSSSFPASKSD
jgi:cation diffusion facilitator CzcD-associated flavoprotein CzcO